MTKPKILITSVGSLAGQNILDALTERRASVEVIGANSPAAAPGNFRCERCYLVPQTAEREAYRSRLAEMMRAERPDLVLPGRDEDVVALAELRRDHPSLAPSIACGSITAAEATLDKLLTFEIARRHGLPFADTAMADASTGHRAVMALQARAGFPLIAKPRQGFASRGVFLILDAQQLERALRLPDLLIQEFLGDATEQLAELPDLSVGIPFFFGLREEGQYAAQTVIDPHGRIGQVFCSINKMVAGRCEAAQRIDSDRLAAVALRYAEVMRAIGWCGSFNLQCKRLANGDFVGFEINGRISGTSSARRFMGYDEIAELFNAFVGPGRLAPLPPADSCSRVTKSLCDFPLSDAAVDTLEREGVWPRFS